MKPGTKGQVVTFYSYKGGVGRSMAVANVATRLAQRGLRVLIVDFDLEAPGLHRYFPSASTPQESDRADRAHDTVEDRPGIIELFYDLRARLDRVAGPTPSVGHAGESPARSEAALESELPASARQEVSDLLDEGKHAYPALVRDPNNGGTATVWLVKAGRFDAEYPDRVRGFDWRALFEAHPYAIEILAEEVGRRFDWILIDSRTGTTDIGNVCTVLFPEKLVLVYTPNEQSLNGAVEVGRQAVELRKSSPDMRPLPLFPLVSRVENAESAMQREWIGEARRRFENVFAEVYRVKKSLSTYFDAVQIPHRSLYAYGERIACEVERVTEAHSLAAAFDLFVDVLMENNAIDAQRVIGARAVPPSAAQERAASAELANLALLERVESAETRSRQLERWRLIAPFATAAVAAVAAAIAFRPTGASHDPAGSSLRACVSAKLPGDSVDALFSTAFGSASPKAVPLLVDPIKRAIIDACSKELLGGSVLWPETIHLHVTGEGAGSLVQCNGDLCTTDSSGNCSLLLRDVRPGEVTCSVGADDAGGFRVSFPASALAEDVTVDRGRDGGSASPPPVESVGISARDGGVSPGALQLARAVANMIETQTQNGNRFLAALEAGHTTNIGMYPILSQYVAAKGARASEVEPYLARVDPQDPLHALPSDPKLRELVKELAHDRQVIDIAWNLLDSGYWRPSVALAAKLGLATPLGIAVIYDTELSGFGRASALVAKTNKMFDGKAPALGTPEKDWISALVKLREPKDVQAQLQKLIDDDNWDLSKPIVIYGIPLITDWVPKK